MNNLIVKFLPTAMATISQNRSPRPELNFGTTTNWKSFVWNKKCNSLFKMATF